MGICFRKEYCCQNPKDAETLSTSTFSKSVRLESNFKLDIKTKYDFIKVIGYGQFGIVREARFKPKTGYHNTPRSFAIKSISKCKLKKSVISFRREVEILMLVDHPNTIKLYEAYEDSKYIHLVMEICLGGDVLEYLISKGTLNEEEISHMMIKMFSAVNHLHSLRICHRDLKPENFLLTSSYGESEPEIKLIDFGMSIKYEDDLMHTMVGTPYYVAPEIINGIYGKECDI